MCTSSSTLKKQMLGYHQFDPTFRRTVSQNLFISEGESFFSRIRFRSREFVNGIKPFSSAAFIKR